MRFAIKKAREGIKKGQSPFAACIVKKDKVVVCIHNAVWKTTDITAHAEVLAIRRVCKILNTINLKGCVLYSTCEPCPMCFSAIHWAKISKIIYGTRIKDAKKIGFSELSISDKKLKQLGKSPVKIVADYMRKENLEIFKEWFKRKDRRVY